MRLRPKTARHDRAEGFDAKAADSHAALSRAWEGLRVRRGAQIDYAAKT